MTMIYKLEELPEGTIINNDMPIIDYFDSYMIMMDTDDSIQELVDKMLVFPEWINTALRLRHHLVAKPFNLRTGRYDMMAEGSTIVPVIDKNENEIVMGQDDKHLYYRLSLLKKKTEQGSKIFLSTVVKFHNIWGRVYFLPVKIGHKLVVKSILKKMARQGRA